MIKSALNENPLFHSLLNTSEMPDLLIVITDLWLIWLFKLICRFD